MGDKHSTSCPALGYVSREPIRTRVLTHVLYTRFVCRCWLDYSNVLMWAYVGPAAGFILVRFFFIPVTLPSLSVWICSNIALV